MLEAWPAWRLVTELKMSPLDVSKMSLLAVEKTVHALDAVGAAQYRAAKRSAKS